MPSFTTFLAAVALLAAVTASAADARPSPAASIDAIIAGLASPERSERAAAEAELLGRGPDALELLPREETISDAATREAVARIRKQLELRRADEAVRPLLLTPAASGPAGQVLRNAQIALSPAQAARRIGLKPTPQPYWSVIDAAARQINAWPDDADPAGRLTFRDRTPEDDAKRVGYAGTFRIAAGPVTVRPTATDRKLIRVPVELRAEPRLRPLFLTCAAKDLTLTGPDGKTFAPFTPEAKYELPFEGRGAAVEMTLDFVATDDVSGPWTLSGKFTATVAAGEERFAFPLAGTRPQEARHGGVTVRLRDVTRTAGSAEIELAVLYDRGGPAFESYRTWVYHNDATLRCAVTTNGERKTHRLAHDPGFDTLAQSNGGVILRYRFEGIPTEADEVTFEYVAPTKIVEAPLTFSIKGLPVHRRL